MARTRGQRRVEEAEAAGHSMTALPDELLLRVLEHAMWQYGLKWWRGALRGVSRRWRALHDGACTKLTLRNGVTDEGMHGLCARLPALTHLDLHGVTSLTEEGLRAVGGLTTLTWLFLDMSSNVTDAVLRELRHLTESPRSPSTATPTRRTWGFNTFRLCLRSPTSSSTAPPPLRRGGTHSRRPFPPYAFCREKIEQ